MTSTKRRSLDSAIRDPTSDGDTMFFAAFGHAVPFAAGHELIRQGRRSLVVAPPVDPDLEPLTALLEKGFE